MKDNKLLIETNDVFAEAGRKFKQSADYERLKNKFRMKTYREKYASLNTTAKVSAIVIATMSILTGIGFIYMLFEDIVPFYGACLLAPVPLLLIEMSKRSIIPHIFKDRLQYSRTDIWMVLIAVFLTSISVFSSFKGTQVWIQYFSPVAETVNLDSIQAEFQPFFSEIDALEATAQTMTWRGKIVSDGRKILKETAQRRSDLQKSLMASLSAAQISNDNSTATHTAKVEEKALFGAIFQLILEFLLIICLRYNEVYDWKTITEHGTPHTTTLQPEQIAPPTFIVKHPAQQTQEEHPELEELAAAKKKVGEGGTIQIPFPPEISEVSKQEKNEVKTYWNVSNDTILVPGFGSRLTLSECRRKKGQYKWKLEQGRGKPSTNSKNIEKMEKAIKILTS